MSSQYLQIFIETAHVASIIPFGNDATIYAMKSFGGFDMTTATFTAIVGASAGQSFNWLLGHALLRLMHNEQWKLRPDLYEKTQRLFHRYGIWLLPLSFVPMLNFITVAAGFLRIPYRLVLPLATLGASAHYSGIF